MATEHYHHVLYTTRTTAPLAHQHEILSNIYSQVTNPYAEGVSLPHSHSQTMNVTFNTQTIDRFDMWGHRDTREGWGERTGRERFERFDRGEEKNSCCAAERDFWVLVHGLHQSGLLKDIDDQQCQEKYAKLMEELKPTTNVDQVLHEVMLADDRFKKGKLIQTWLETCARERVTSIPRPTNKPMAVTLHRIRNESQQHRAGMARSRDRSSSCKSIQPDEQITTLGHLLKLDGSDQVDQENLLKMIWSLIRSGQLEAACEEAKAHQVYWLSAALEGAIYPFYRQEARYIDPADCELNDIDGGMDTSIERNIDDNDNEQVLVTVRKGNVRWPIFLRSCWRYAEKLASSTNTWSMGAMSHENTMEFNRESMRDSLSGILDMSIYAAISNNTKVLMRSPLITSWSDQLWVVMKAAHECDVLRVLHHLHFKQSQHSQCIPGCSSDIRAAERDLLQWSLASERSAANGISKGDCSVQLAVITQSISSSPKANELLLQLQAAVISGRTGVQRYINDTVMTVVQSPTFAHSEVVLRVYAHFVLWLRVPFIDPSFGDEHDLRGLVSDEVLHLVLESYIAYLIRSQQWDMVALYAAELCVGRRVAVYVQLLRSVSKYQSSSNLDEVESAAVRLSVIEQASQLFAEDLPSVLRIHGELLVSENDNLESILPSALVYGPIALEPLTWSQRLHALGWLLVPSDFRVEALNFCGKALMQSYFIATGDYEGRTRSGFADGGGIDRMHEIFQRFNKSFPEEIDDSEYGLRQHGNMLWFWSGYLLLRQNILKWKNSVSNFYAKQDRISGSMQIMISSMTQSVQTADSLGREVTDGIFDILNGVSSQQFADGIGELFGVAESYALARLDMAIAGAYELMQHINGFSQNSFSAKILEGSITIIRQIESQTRALFREDWPMHAKLKDLCNQIKISGDIFARNGTPSNRFASTGILNENSMDDAAYLELGLRDIVVCLDDVACIRSCSRDVIFELIVRHVEVCAGMGSMWQSLQHTSNASLWYTKGVRLADLVASEMPSLRLSSIINRADLRSLLQKFNGFALHLLELESEFQL